MKTSRLFTTAFVAILSCQNCRAVEGEVSVGEVTSSFSVVQSSAGVTVLEGIRPVLTYQRAVRDKEGKWPRSNYVHPLYGLDGEVLTEDFPDDHGHHRGIFWSWHQVMVGEHALGDAWVCRDFQWDVVEVLSSTSHGAAHIRATSLWKSPALLNDRGRSKPIVRETTIITVHPSTPEYRLIDFDIRLRAVQPDVRIGGSDDDKGYGGFSPRIKLSGNEVFLSATGEVEPTKLQIQCGPWLDISNPQFGLAMLTHASNPGFPQPWILRRSRSMQNAAYPGRQLVALSTEESLRLRYRLVVHRGTLDSARFNELQGEFESLR